MQHFMINQNYSFINLLFFHLILFLFKLIPLFFHFKNASQISNFILFPTLILFFLHLQLYFGHQNREGWNTTRNLGRK